VPISRAMDVVMQNVHELDAKRGIKRHVRAKHSSNDNVGARLALPRRNVIAGVEIRKLSLDFALAAFEPLATDFELGLSFAFRAPLPLRICDGAYWRTI
jgi:hypothetical protein